MGLSLRYPDHVSPSATADFSKSPSVNGSQQAESQGYASHVMSDQLTVRSYRYSQAYKVHTLAFDGLSEIDKSDWDTFAAAILADSFEIQDSTGGCGLFVDWTVVKIDPAGQIRTWRPQSGQRWAFTLVLREIESGTSS